jgi:hypothetical protein
MQQDNKNWCIRVDFVTAAKHQIKWSISFNSTRWFNANKYLLGSSLRLLSGGSRINERSHPRHLETTERTSMTPPARVDFVPAASTSLNGGISFNSQGCLKQISTCWKSLFSILDTSLDTCNKFYK